MFEVGKSTAHRWVRSHPATRTPRRSRSCLLTEARQVISAYVATHPFCIAASIAEHLREQLGAAPSRSTVSRTLKKAGMTRKLPSLSTSAASGSELADKRTAFCSAIRGLDCRDAVSIDESSFYFRMRPTLGYSARGQRLNVSKPLRVRRQRFTLVLAVSVNGIVGWEVFEGSCTSQVFARFIEQTDFGSSRVALIDNVSFHHTALVRQGFASKRIEVLYLPPYTPQWQPIEYVFSRLKRAYRQVDIMEAPFLDRVEGVLALAHCSSRQPFLATFEHCWALATREVLWADNPSTLAAPA